MVCDFTIQLGKFGFCNTLRKKLVDKISQIPIVNPHSPPPTPLWSAGFSLVILLTQEKWKERADGPWELLGTAVNTF